MRKSPILTACVVLMLLLLFGCEMKEAQVPVMNNIVATAAEANDMGTFVAALRAADMAPTLEGEGPFTVFAPSNRAFEKLPPGMLDSLLQPANKDKLAGILKYHVVQGEYTADKISKMSSLPTLAGEPLSILVKDGKITISGATVIERNIGCSNGVIHMIDMVIMPPAAADNIVATAMANKDLETLVKTLKAAGLIDTLEEEGPFTIFAPTNAAFGGLPPGKLQSLMMPQNKQELAGILKYHIVRGKYTADKIARRRSLRTLAGKSLTITKANGKLTIDGATMTQTDIICANGVIHMVDSVLMPPGEEEKASMPD
ncbi:MAG: fasciclin domain-containing protein [Planctomycetes bacterium]|nr:fasciclin domain-containing protein [Planctomycetota bacterium]